VVEDHSTDPLVVGPATETGDGVDGSNVEENEKKASSAARETFIMRRHLLWANCLEQGLHVVEVREDKRVLVTVVGMNVALSHVLQVLLIVSLSVLSSVLRLWAI